jgi:3'-phosphoadenosine 5'-phosphosulfate sulfotransferase (PAPS reductase)/FAD synthetase
MAALKEIPPVDAAIHADTGWERRETYEFARKWTSWLEKLGVPVVTVRDPSSLVVGQQGGATFIPAFTIGESGKGALRRQCTNRWKIVPLRQAISRELVARGLKKTPGVVDVLLGISLDEFQRARTADVKYTTNTFPLLDMRMTRQDCLSWLESHGIPSPGKSSCVFCPYHNKAAFQELRETPEDWATAVRVDEAIRYKRPNHISFVHPLRIPLREAVVLDTPEPEEEEAGCPGSYCFM